MDLSQSAAFVCGGVLVAMILAALTAGCSTPQLSSVSAEKQQLLATIEAQKAELAQLRERSAKLEARLATSEKQIARLDPAASIRPDADDAQPALAWRAHAAPNDGKTLQRR